MRRYCVRNREAIVVSVHERTYQHVDFIRLSTQPQSASLDSERSTDRPHKLTAGDFNAYANQAHDLEDRLMRGIMRTLSARRTDCAYHFWSSQSRPCYKPVGLNRVAYPILIVDFHGKLSSREPCADISKILSSWMGAGHNMSQAIQMSIKFGFLTFEFLGFLVKPRTMCAREYAPFQC